MRAFAGIAQAATASNALDSKTKELIALGIAVAVRCDDCIAFHAKAAVEHGATKDEVSETLGTSMGAQVMLSKRSRSSRYQSDPCLDEA